MKTNLALYLKLTIALFLGFGITAAFAQEKVDQGKPGNQGGWYIRGAYLSDGGPAFPVVPATTADGGAIGIWPVTIVGGGISFSSDGGNLGSVSVNNIVYTIVLDGGGSSGAVVQGPGQDGGAWNVTIQGGVSTSSWYPDGGSIGSVVQGTGQDGGAWDVSIGSIVYTIVLDGGGTSGPSTQGNGQDGGAWNMSLSTTTFPGDGGYPMAPNVTLASGYVCGASSVQNVWTMDAGAVTIGTLNPRLYTVVCNSRENSSGNLRCRVDGTAASTTVGAIGTVLGVGDCVPYTNPVGKAISCAGGGGLLVTSYECAP